MAGTGGDKTAENRSRAIISTPRPIELNSPIVSGVTADVLQTIAKSDEFAEFIRQFCVPTKANMDDSQDLERLQALLGQDHYKSGSSLRARAHGYVNVEVGQFPPSKQRDILNALSIAISPKRDAMKIGVISFQPKHGSRYTILDTHNSFRIVIRPVGGGAHDIVIERFHWESSKTEKDPDCLGHMDANTYNAMLVELLGIVYREIPESAPTPGAPDVTPSAEEKGFGWFGDRTRFDEEAEYDHYLNELPEEPWGLKKFLRHQKGKKHRRRR